MKRLAAENMEQRLCSIGSLLSKQGVGKMLDYFCTYSVFSIE